MNVIFDHFLACPMAVLLWSYTCLDLVHFARYSSKASGFLSNYDLRVINGFNTDSLFCSYPLTKLSLSGSICTGTRSWKFGRIYTVGSWASCWWIAGSYPALIDWVPAWGRAYESNQHISSPCRSGNYLISEGCISIRTSYPPKF